MAVEGIIRKTVGGFVPVEGDFDSLPLGKDLRVKITVARSSPQNRWFHKVLQELFANQDTWPTFTLFRNAIKEALGVCEVYDVKGKRYVEYHSFAFHKMEQSDFNQFLDRFVRLVCERIIPQLDEQATWDMLRLLDADNGALGDRKIA